MRVVLEGLSHLDRMELEEQLRPYREDDSDAVVELREKTTPTGSFGEPITIIAIIGGLAIKGLIAYLVLRNPKDEFRETVTVEYPDGRKVTHTIEFVVEKDRPVSDQVIEHLSAMTGESVASLLTV